MPKYILLVLAMVALCCNLYGQTCCSGGVPVSSNIGLQSKEDKSLVLSLSSDFNNLRTLYSGSELLDDDLRKRSTQSYILRGAYNLAHRIGVEVFVPMIRQTRSIITNGGAEDFQSSFGVGDPILMLYYHLLQSNINLTIGAGPQIPLGSFSQRNNRGLLLIEDLQPGSGAWDFIFFSSMDYGLARRPSMNFFTRVIYSATGTNSKSRGGTQEYTFGDDIQIIAGLSDQLLIGNSILSPGFSFRYRNAARDMVDGISNSGTGGKWLFAKGFIGTEFFGESSLTLSLEVPISTFVNETQLSPTSIFNISIQKSFNLSKNDNAIINF